MVVKSSIEQSLNGAPASPRLVSFNMHRLPGAILITVKCSRRVYCDWQPAKQS
jgi:hypothetical protein